MPPRDTRGRDGAHMSRRTFTVTGAMLVANAAMLTTRRARADAPPAAAAVALPALPYAEDALAPVISAATVATHHGQHHRTYVERTNALASGTPLAGKPLETIVRMSARAKAQRKLFQAAAQTYNHNLYWESMKPAGGGAPQGPLSARLDRDFGSYAAFREQFLRTAVDHFSNGWVWLVLQGGHLRIVETDDADTPLTTAGALPLLTLDVWEHAYYLDVKNRRKEYVTGFLDALLNWENVERRLEGR